MGRCTKCHLRWLLDPPTGKDLADLYESGFYAGAARGGFVVRALHGVNNAIRLRVLDGIPVGRLLDIGSGKGRFLGAAKGAGWDVLGIEFAEGAAATARSTFGVEVITGDFIDTPVEGPFDAITIWHTLEHLPDPAAALSKVAGLLPPGGHVIVSVPNSASAQARWGGSVWFHLDLPRHLYHLTPASLSALLERSGFSVMRIGHFYPEMEAIGLIQTALNKAGLGQDILYRFAKRDTTAVPGVRLMLSAILALTLVPVALVWSGIAPAFRTGASIQVVARLKAPRVNTQSE